MVATILLYPFMSFGSGIEGEHAAIRENFVGVKPTHGQEASVRPDRITVVADPNFVRSGRTAIRFAIEPGDCGGSIDAHEDQWNDCSQGSERIEIGTDDSFKGKWFHAFSIKLGDDFRSLPGSEHINLMQFKQRPGQANCFNIVFDTSTKRLRVVHRCPDGKWRDLAGHQYPGRTSPRSPFGEWNEIIIAANWTKREDGYFRVLHNGELVYAYSGSTFVSDGESATTDKWFIYRYGGLRRYPNLTSTMYLDDIMRVRRLSQIETRYEFDRMKLGFR